MYLYSFELLSKTQIKTYDGGRVFMELFGEWFLNHRSEADLVELVKLAGVKLNQVSIDQEPLKVNLFLRIKNKPG